MITEIILNALTIVLSMVIMQYVARSKRYESDLDNKILSLFLLAIFFIMLKALVEIFLMLGMKTLLISNTATIVYDALAVVSILLGAYYSRY
ncbi:hypothetical protein D6777_00040 [Candidatus Woesearchaeota archaeon]|nr:MAG: hypothetical protein D6777_00040 [Candidatus Woesearchaeota archaeon]